jgi:hypothetical protein
MPNKKNPGLFRAGRPPKFEGKRVKRPYVENHRQPHAGRPRKKIDWEMVKRMAGRGCTPEEMALFIGVSEPTLRSYENFFVIYKDAYVRGNIEIRRIQHEVALEGNVPMLKFLGKARLGQTDTALTSASTSMKDGPTDQHSGGLFETEIDH